eukprot:scaffold3923_cov48-Phaeocystis_antarctica.AAC.1
MGHSPYHSFSSAGREQKARSKTVTSYSAFSSCCHVSRASARGAPMQKIVLPEPDIITAAKPSRERLVRLEAERLEHRGGRQPVVRLDEVHRAVGQRRQRLDELAAPRAHGGAAREEEAHVGAELGAPDDKLLLRHREACQPVGSMQRRRRIRRAAAEATLRRHLLVEAAVHPPLLAGAICEYLQRAHDQVARVRRDELGAEGVGRYLHRAEGRSLVLGQLPEVEPVHERDGLEERRELVEAIGPLAEDAQEEVDLGWCEQRERRRLAAHEDALGDRRGGCSAGARRELPKAASGS